MSFILLLFVIWYVRKFIWSRFCLSLTQHQHYESYYITFENRSFVVKYHYKSRYKNFIRKLFHKHIIWLYKLLKNVSSPIYHKNFQRLEQIFICPNRLHNFHRLEASQNMNNSLLPIYLKLRHSKLRN